MSVNVSNMAQDSGPFLFNVLSHIFPGSASASFFFGMLVVALYATKRLGELISPPRAEEYDFTKMLTLSTMVGKDSFLRSYFFYVFFLEFLYVFLCLTRPIVSVLVDSESGITFDNTSWPLGAALLVVGVLPATPIVAQVEAGLRRLAHSLAQIPDDFFGRVSALSTSDLESLVANVPQYKSEVDLYWTINNLLLILSFPADDAARMARRFISVRLFREWTIDGRDIWSQREFDRYKEVFDLLKPRSDSLEKDVNNLITLTKNNAYILDALRAHPSFILRDKPIDYLVVDDIRRKVDFSRFNKAQIKGSAEAPTTFDSVELLRERWLSKAHESDVAGRRLIALFSIIARNDKIASHSFTMPSNSTTFNRGGTVNVAINQRHNDPVLRELARLATIESQALEPWYNSILIANVAAFFICLLGLWIYLSAIDFSLLDSKAAYNFGDSVKESLLLSAGTTVEYCLSFLFAGLAALFIRSIKVRDHTWIVFEDIRRIPITQYMSVLVVATIAAFTPSMVSYVAFYTFVEPSTFASQAPATLWSAISTRLLFALIWGFVGASACVIADFARPNNRSTNSNSMIFCYGAIFISLLLCALILIATPGIAVASRPFWHRLVGVLFVTAIGILSFSASLRARSVR